MVQHDRSYYRMLKDNLLIEYGLDSTDELAVALAERLEDIQHGESPEDLMRRVADAEDKADYWKSRCEELEREIAILTEDEGDY